MKKRLNCRPPSIPARCMLAVGVVLWLFLFSPTPGGATDLDSVSLGNVSEGLLWAARGTVRIDDSTDVGFELVFQSAGEEGLKVSVLPSQHLASLVLPNGRITSRQLRDNTKVVTFSRGDGWSCSASFDESGNLIRKADAVCVRRGLKSIIRPARSTLDAFSLICESHDIIRPAQDGLFVGTDARGLLPDWFNCIAGGAAWVASWGSLVACTTGFGCVVAVGLITGTGAQVADACAGWAHDAGDDGSSGDGSGDGGDGEGDSAGGSGG
jgi:hypothetical protein